MGKLMKFLKQKSAAQAEEHYKDGSKKSLAGRVDNYLGITPEPARIPQPGYMQAIVDRVESELDMEERALARGGEPWRLEQIELNKKAELAVQKLKRQKEAWPHRNGNPEWLRAYEIEELLVAWIDLLKADRLWIQSNSLRWPYLAERGFLRTAVRTEPTKLAYSGKIILDGRQDFRASYVRKLMQGVLPPVNNEDIRRRTSTDQSAQFAKHVGGVAMVRQSQEYSFHKQLVTSLG